MDQDGQDQGAAWMRHSLPGPGHALLAGFAGTWRQENQIWPVPGAPPQAFSAMSEMRMLYGGRFLHQSMKGGMEMQGMTVEFEGTGHFGFDNFKQKHFFAWIDNSSTILMYGEGEADAAGRITYFGELPDPLTGGPAAFKAVLWKEGEDRFVFDNLARLPDGEWTLKMRMEASRA